MTKSGIILFDKSASFDLLTSQTPFTILSQPPIKSVEIKMHINRKLKIPRQQDKYKIVVIINFLNCLNFSFMFIYLRFWLVCNRI